MSEMNELLGEEFGLRDDAAGGYLATMQSGTSLPQIPTGAFPEVLTQLKPHHVEMCEWCSSVYTTIPDCKQDEPAASAPQGKLCPVPCQQILGH